MFEKSDHPGPGEYEISSVIKVIHLLECFFKESSVLEE